MALAIEARIVRGQFVALTLRWNAGDDTALLEAAVHPVRGIGLVGDEQLGLRQIGDQAFGSLVIAALALGQVEPQRPPLPVANDMQLAGQPATAAPDTSG